MLRVLVHDALAAALLHGFERISFQGYCIEARRFSAAGAEGASVDLALTANGGAELLDRVRIAVAFPGQGAFREEGAMLIIDVPKSHIAQHIERVGYLEKDDGLMFIADRATDGRHEFANIGNMLQRHLQQMKSAR